MSEAADEEKPTIVTSIRENVKENIRIARLRHRQDEVDNFRITLGQLEDATINLQTYSTSDVLDSAAKIKKQRHASSSELMKLSHAFLQSSENITCFINSTGAVPVIVKELTGAKTESQMLAAECLCNLSLGSEADCQKIAQRAGSYLHTFLQSSNESLARASLWCLTNLIVAGQKPLTILLSQELIKALVNCTVSSKSQNLVDESYSAIKLVLDHGGVPRPSDVETLSKWILNSTSPLDPRITKIIYKLLNLLNFQSNDAIRVQKLVHFCIDTLIHIHDEYLQLPNLNESLHQAVLLMRIASNIIALENSFGGYIIEHWFQSQNRSMAGFFNHFIDLFPANGLSIEEIYWFIGNLMKCPINESITKFIECDEFFLKIKIIASGSVQSSS